jgi:hypothetical protein
MKAPTLEDMKKLTNEDLTDDEDERIAALSVAQALASGTEGTVGSPMPESGKKETEGFPVSESGIAKTGMPEGEDIG